LNYHALRNNIASVDLDEEDRARKVRAQVLFDQVDVKLVTLRSQQKEKHQILKTFDDKNSSLISIDGLKEYAMMCVKPGIDYYEKTYNTEGGDLYRFKRACQAAQIFDPFFLSHATMAELEEKVNELIFFDHHEIFTNAFIGLLIVELPSLVTEARKVVNIDWTEIDDDTKSCERYNNRLVKRQQRQMRMNQVNDAAPDDLDEYNVGEARMDIILEYRDWKDDPGERARRIALWWKHHIITLKKNFTNFAEAFKVVAVTQVSSALIARLFSHLSNVVNTSSENQLEQTIETRLILEANKAISQMDFL
jgi:hypothetical protein